MEPVEQVEPPAPKRTFNDFFMSLMADETKRKTARENLEILLHAKGCEIREAQFNIRCYLPHCANMKRVINHLRNCKAGYKCPTRGCTGSRLILSHWKHCVSDCVLCSPIRQRAERQRNAERLAEEAAARLHPPRGAMRRKYARG